MQWWCVISIAHVASSLESMAWSRTFLIIIMFLSLVLAAEIKGLVQVLVLLFLPKNMTNKDHIFDQEYYLKGHNYDLKRSYFRAFGPILASIPQNMT